jgi:hypothetical protein
MTQDSDTGSEAFDRQLTALFDAPLPGLESPELEGRILARLVQRRRVRALVLGLGGLIGLCIAIRSFLQTGVPSPATQAIIDMASGKALVRALDGALGSGMVGTLAVCAGLTVLGLALVRALEAA